MQQAYLNDESLRGVCKNRWPSLWCRKRLSWLHSMIFGLQRKTHIIQLWSSFSRISRSSGLSISTHGMCLQLKQEQTTCARVQGKYWVSTAKHDSLLCKVITTEWSNEFNAIIQTSGDSSSLCKQKKNISGSSSFSGLPALQRNLILAPRSCKNGLILYTNATIRTLSASRTFLRVSHILWERGNRCKQLEWAKICPFLFWSQSLSYFSQE